jgi:hypothetical protein
VICDAIWELWDTPTANAGIFSGRNDQERRIDHGRFAIRLLCLSILGQRRAGMRQVISPEALRTASIVRGPETEIKEGFPAEPIQQA